MPVQIVRPRSTADAIGCVAENRVSEGEFWISAAQRGYGHAQTGTEQAA
jgi:hypothetical protein